MQDFAKEILTLSLNSVFNTSQWVTFVKIPKSHEACRKYCNLTVVRNKLGLNLVCSFVLPVTEKNWKESFISRMGVG